ncbi:MAG: TonB-dependent receptor plug domain-containing protein [Desulfomonilia bacterium]|jgi:vitamin B12 transporter|uniref:Vitamin B12 transporter BtuB n=1 Tax=anaerobic digester metagenome TaxID=1263854 RepID=A0A485M4E4_9ZZZZ
MHHRFTAAIALGILCFFLSSLPFFPAHAEEIIVTATAIDDTSSSSVTGKSPTAFSDIVEVRPLATGLINTRDALRKAVSIDLPDYGGAVAAPVSLRGSAIQQTLIMLDGVPLNPVSGDTVDLSLYSVPEIDRIEIIKGSNSAAYGGSAMGGVVNIVTRNPRPGDSLEFTSSLGTYGYSLYNLFLNTEAGGTGLLLDVTRSQADNDFLYERDDGTTARRENNRTEHTALLSKLWMDIGGWDTLLTGTLAAQELGSPGVEGWLTPDDDMNTSRYSFMIDTSKELDPGRSLALKASRMVTRACSYTFPSGDARSRLTSDYFDAIYSHGMGLLRLAPEVTVRRERLSSDYYGIHSRTVTSGVLHSTLDLDPVLFSLALRHDHSTEFKGKWTWHGGVLWDVMPHLDLKANVGIGYREPTLGQLYAPSSDFFTFVPNPDLKPEESFGWDIGPVIEFELFGLSASYFVARYSDMIKMGYPTYNTFTYVNVDRAHASGVETYAWVKPVDPLRISLGYAFNQFRYGSGSFESKRVKHKPQDIFTLQADYLAAVLGRQVNIFTSYQFREGVYTDDANTRKTGNRNLIDAGIACEITRFATAAFKVSNLLDDTSVEYEDRSEWGSFWFPVPGRTYRVSLQMRF